MVVIIVSAVFLRDKDGLSDWKIDRESLTIYSLVLIINNIDFRRYSMKGEGRIQDVEVHGIQKRYDQEKYYVFILKITRQNVKVPTYIFRTYK